MEGKAWAWVLVGVLPCWPSCPAPRLLHAMRGDPCHPAHRTAAPPAASAQAAAVTRGESTGLQPAERGVMGRAGLGPRCVLREAGKESRGVKEEPKGPGWTGGCLRLVQILTNAQIFYSAPKPSSSPCPLPLPPTISWACLTAVGVSFLRHWVSGA